MLLPNLYYRTTREFELGATRDHPDAEANLKKMFAMVASIANDKVAADVGAILDKLPSLADAKPGKIGLVGYCMSGAFVTVAAARHPDRIGCFASYYGTRLITDKPDSPHLRLSGHQGRGLLRLRRARHLRANRPGRRLREAVWPPRRSRRAPKTERGTHHGYALQPTAATTMQRLARSH